MSDITASDLNKSKDEKNLKRNSIYRKILQKCLLKIQKMNDMNNNKIVYEVPGFLFGSPLYKYEDCIIYLENKLQKRDFKVEKINDISLLISW